MSLRAIKDLIKSLPVLKHIAYAPAKFGNREFWTRYNVTLHKDFASREESLDYLNWRNSQYMFYDQLMPTSGFMGLKILDYGCGPCHDVVGFIENSPGSEITGVDMSATSLDEGRQRIALHGASNTRLMLINDRDPSMPFPDNYFDYIHSSGVLHHVEDLPPVLAELKRVLRPDGFMRVMLYNYDSIWMHLHCGYVLRVKEGIYKDLSLEEAFKRTTDTKNCPVSRCYKASHFIEYAGENGFDALFLGAAVSVDEMMLLEKRYDAIKDMRLPAEHRDFLMGLTFDEFGRPVHNGQVAGIDAVYELRRKA
jgi:ubiquinone/menaquinone biosynthesis C-methylase UbiE